MREDDGKIIKGRYFLLNLEGTSRYCLRTNESESLMTRFKDLKFNVTLVIIRIIFAD